MASWGAVMVPASVVGDREMALEVRAQAGPQLVISDYPPWLVVQPANLNPDEIVTSQLSLLRINSSGALRSVDGVATIFTPPPGNLDWTCLSSCSLSGASSIPARRFSG